VSLVKSHGELREALIGSFSGATKKARAFFEKGNPFRFFENGMRDPTDSKESDNSI